MEVKKTVSTAELLPSISALKIEMQKKGYSPQTIRGLENVWDTLLRYASTVPATSFDEKLREEFLRTEYGFRIDLEYTMYRVSRALELLKNYIEFGVVTGFSKRNLHEFSDSYRPLMTAFADGEARRGLAESSLKSLWSRLYRLHLFFIFCRAHIADKKSTSEHPIRKVEVEICRLVMNQGDQRGYHQCKPRQFDCGILIAKRFAGTGGHVCQDRPAA